MPESISVLDSTESHSTVTVGRSEVSHVAFAPDRVLARHSHPRGCLAVVVGGAVEKSFARCATTARAGAVVTMPAEEPHADTFGRAGARIVVVETNDNPVPDGVSWSRDWDSTVIALRIARELAAPDDFTPLALEGLILELTAARRRHPQTTAKTPRWLRSACELLDERLPAPPSLGEIAAEVGLHPAHVARAFRAHLGESVGSYTRRRRLEWAAGELVGSDTPLRTLALAAGFADQSHFTRAFKCFAGVAPGRFRETHSR